MRSSFLLSPQGVSYRDLVSGSQAVGKHVSMSNVFKPRIDGHFLLDYPIRLLERGEFLRVDTMRGFNTQENGNSVQDSKNDGFTIKEFRNKVTRFIQSFPYVNADDFSKKMEDFYIGNATDPFVIRQVGKKKYKN